MSLRALGIPSGTVLRHLGLPIRVIGDLGGVAIAMEHVADGSDFLVRDPVNGDLLHPTIGWIFAEKEAGRLEDPAGVTTMNGRRFAFMGLDRSACDARDPKAAWRYRWAMAALRTGPATTSDDSYETWIASRKDLVPASDGRPEPLPRASTLRGWVRTLKAVGAKRGALVSCAGRLPGQSPLPPLESRLVDEAATFFHAAEASKIVDAGTYYHLVRKNLLSVPATAAGLSSRPVRLETIRARARKREDRDALAAKEGERHAKRMVDTPGELAFAEHFLERVYVDGGELRQHVVFADDWPVPAGKMKFTVAIDGATLFWWPPAIYCGPHRDEMTTQALLNVMSPSPEIRPERLAAEPLLQSMVGTPGLWKPDNERILIGPGLTSALGELGCLIELPAVHDPDAKSPAELVVKFGKEFMARLPGTVRGPRKRKDPTRNAVKEGEMTRAQCVYHLMEAWWVWNTAKRDVFGGRSSIDMVKLHLEQRRPLMHPPLELRRALSKTREGILTREGLEFDGALYRSDSFARVLSRNFHLTGFRDRVDGTEKVKVSFRTFESDLSGIEIFDEVNCCFVEGREADPYFDGLGRWEHDQHKLYENTRRPRRDREVVRAEAASDSLRAALAELPGSGTKVATQLAGLLEAAERRNAAADRPDAPAAPLLGAFLFAGSGHDARRGAPKPVPCPSPKRKPKGAPAPTSVIERIDPEQRNEAEDDDRAAPRSDEFAWPDLPDDDDDNEDEDEE